jgi:hypothetical protein
MSFSSRWVPILFTAFILLLLPQPAACQTETVLLNFNDGRNGGSPEWGLAADSRGNLDPAGNLYGTTSRGEMTYNDDYGLGIVFQVSP